MLVMLSKPCNDRLPTMFGAEESEILMVQIQTEWLKYFPEHASICCVVCTTIPRQYNVIFETILMGFNVSQA